MSLQWTWSVGLFELFSLDEAWMMILNSLCEFLDKNVIGKYLLAWDKFWQLNIWFSGFELLPGVLFSSSILGFEFCFLGFGVGLPFLGFGPRVRFVARKLGQVGLGCEWEYANLKVFPRFQKSNWLKLVLSKCSKYGVVGDTLRGCFSNLISGYNTLYTNPSPAISYFEFWICETWYF